MRGNQLRCLLSTVHAVNCQSEFSRHQRKHADFALRVRKSVADCVSKSAGDFFQTMDRWWQNVKQSTVEQGLPLATPLLVCRIHRIHRLEKLVGLGGGHLNAPDHRAIANETVRVREPNLIVKNE